MIERRILHGGNHVTWSEIYFYTDLFQTAKQGSCLLKSVLALNCKIIKRTDTSFSGQNSVENSLNTLRYADRVKELGPGKIQTLSVVRETNSHQLLIYSHELE